MKRLMVVAATALLSLAVSPVAFAGAQQEKMKTCNAEAKDKNLAGEERKAFMKDCLSAKPAAAGKAKTAQQEKMTSCNADAKSKNLKGDERKKFMSECLKG